MKLGELFTLIAALAVVIGIVWFFLTGSFWQFIPIGVGIAVGRILGTAIQKD